MANSILTPTQVTRKALQILHQKLNFIGSINRSYDDSFAKEGAKIGTDLKIRLPNQYSVTSGAVFTGQDTTESSVTLQVNNQKHVGLNFTSQDLTLSMDDFSDRVLDPAMSVLAANIESDVLSNVYKDVYNQVNNHGASATFNKLLQGGKILDDNLAPVNDRSICMNTQDRVDLVDALKGLFNDQTALSKQYREGVMGRTAGFDFMQNTMMPSHTRGAATTAYTTDTRTSALPTTLPNTPVSSITVATGTGGGLKGDVFTIANVFRVHPETKASTGILQQFVVSADFSSTTVTFQPAIILAGPAQNVTIPTTSATAAISWAGTISVASGLSLAYQKNAFTFATADLYLPKGLDFAAREVFDGISMRIIRDFDPINDKLVTRADVLYGFKTLRPQLAVRLANN